MNSDLITKDYNILLPEPHITSRKKICEGIDPVAD